MPVATPAPIAPSTQPTTQATQPTTRSSLPESLATPSVRLIRRPVGMVPKDPQPAVQITTRFDVFDIVLPIGAVSARDAFWKHVDESAVPASAVLRRNGLRVGIAPAGAWPTMRGLIDDGASTTRTRSATARDAGLMELPMKRDVASQSIFTFAADGSLSGRSFDRSENVLAVSFAQSPRKPGQMRVAVSPVVRSMRQQLSYSVLGNEQEWSMIYPERAMDITLRADVPMDHVLIVAPAAGTATPGSVGQAFLLIDTPAERQERVLLMVPRVYRIENER